MEITGTEQPDVSYTGVNHLAMATGDMDKTIRFWRDILGMRLVAGLGEPGYRHYFFEISQSDLIAFFEWKDVEPMVKKEHGRPVDGKFGFDHVSIGVEKEEDLWELKDRLEAAGFKVSEVIDHGFIHSIYTFDPNNIPIEFSNNVKGIDIRKSPRMGDKQPTSAALEGPEPVKDKWPEVERRPVGKKRIYRGAGSELFHGYEEEINK